MEVEILAGDKITTFYVANVSSFHHNLENKLSRYFVLMSTEKWNTICYENMDTMIPTTIYYKCVQNMFYLHYMLIMQ